MTQNLPHSHLTQGTLLIANPDINSFRSVILLCEHHEEGSFGLLINKPLTIKVPEEIIDIHQCPNPHIELRNGGPSQPHQMIFLHSSTTLREQAAKICEDLYLSGDLPFLQQAINDPNGPYIHLFFGCHSWGPGELEQEFLEGKWFLYPATSSHLFQIPPEKLWRSLLKEMGGKYASLSTIPEDLSLN